MLVKFLQRFIEFWDTLLTGFRFVKNFNIFCGFIWDRLSEFVPFEKILPDSTVHDIFSIFLNQIFLIFFSVLGNFRILIKFLFPHLIQHNLLRIFFLILFYHLINLRLSFSILFVRIILPSFREIFVWRVLYYIVLLILIWNSFFGFVWLLNRFHLSSMSL